MLDMLKGRGANGSNGANGEKVGLGSIRRPVIGLALGGAAPGPEGGARLTAAPGSGTAAGGTGGGRSENNCA